MKIRWTETALQDLESLHAYVAQDSDNAAAKIVTRILAGLDAVKRFPGMGRKGRVAGTREVVIPPFIVVYRFKKDAVELLAIIHGARRWPDPF